MNAFFQWEQELRRFGIPNKHSVTTGQSGGELIGVCGAKLYARERASTEAFKQKAGPFFLHFAIPFLGSKSGPKTGSTKLPSNSNHAESLTPFLGPQNSLGLFQGPACCNLFSPCRVTVFWRMARYVDAKFANMEVLFGMRLACKSI